jgi:hypothetical protein
MLQTAKVTSNNTVEQCNSLQLARVLGEPSNKQQSTSSKKHLLQSDAEKKFMLFVKEMNERSLTTRKQSSDLRDVLTSNTFKINPQ